MESKFFLTFSGLSESDAKRAQEDPKYLRQLCSEEVSSFARYVELVDPQFSKSPLLRPEKLAIEGYLYQKVKGHLDEFLKGKDI